MSSVRASLLPSLLALALVGCAVPTTLPGHDPASLLAAGGLPSAAAR